MLLLFGLFHLTKDIFLRALLLFVVIVGRLIFHLSEDIFLRALLLFVVVVGRLIFHLAKDVFVVLIGRRLLAGRIHREAQPGVGAGGVIALAEQIFHAHTLPVGVDNDVIGAHLKGVGCGVARRQGHALHHFAIGVGLTGRAHLEAFARCRARELLPLKLNIVRVAVDRGGADRKRFTRDQLRGVKIETRQRWREVEHPEHVHRTEVIAPALAHHRDLGRLPGAHLHPGGKGRLTELDLLAILINGHDLHVVAPLFEHHEVVRKDHPLLTGHLQILEGLLVREVQLVERALIDDDLLPLTGFHDKTHPGDRLDLT